MQINYVDCVIFLFVNATDTSYSRRQNKVPIVYRLTTDLWAELSAKVAEKSP